MRRKLMVALVLALAIGLVAFAAVSHASSTPPAVPSQPAIVVHAAAPADGDNVQAGDQTAPDAVTATETSAAGETEAAAAAESSAEAPGDQNLPDGGHQDANGANVDHQFEGVE